jgi:hypothetical protein
MKSGVDKDDVAGRSVELETGVPMPEAGVPALQEDISTQTLTIDVQASTQEEYDAVLAQLSKQASLSGDVSLGVRAQAGQDIRAYQNGVLYEDGGGDAAAAVKVDARNFEATLASMEQNAVRIARVDLPDAEARLGVTFVLESGDASMMDGYVQNELNQSVRPETAAGAVDEISNAERVPKAAQPAPASSAPGAADRKGRVTRSTESSAKQFERPKGGAERANEPVTRGGGRARGRLETPPVKDEMRRVESAEKKTGALEGARPERRDKIADAERGVFAGRRGGVGGRGLADAAAEESEVIRDKFAPPLGEQMQLLRFPASMPAHVRWIIRLLPPPATSQPAKHDVAEPSTPR